MLKMTPMTPQLIGLATHSGAGLRPDSCAGLRLTVVQDSDLTLVQDPVLYLYLQHGSNVKNVTEEKGRGPAWVWGSD